MNGYYTAELIREPARTGPRKNVEDVELAPLAWVPWHNTARLDGYLRDVSPQSSRTRFTPPHGPTNPWSESNSPSLHRTQGRFTPRGPRLIHLPRRSFRVGRLEVTAPRRDRRP